MKKVALSLIALLAAGTFAFAQDTAAESAAAVSVKLAADAKTKFGVDLDTKKVGFKNEANFDLDLTIVPEADSFKSGTGDVYGTIKIEDVSIAVDNEDGEGAESDDDDGVTDKGVYDHDEWLHVGDITAKIVFPNGYFKIYKNTDPAVDYGIDGDDDNDGESIVADDAFYTYHNKYGADKTEWTFGTLPGGSALEGTGVSLYYELPSLVGFTFDVATREGWESGNQAEAALTVAQKAVEKLTAEVKYYRGTSTYEGTEYDLSEKEGVFDGDAKDPFIVQAAGLSLAYDVGVAEPFLNVNYFLSARNHYDEVADEKDYNEDGDEADEFTLLYSKGYAEGEIGSKLALVDGFKAIVAVNYSDAGAQTYSKEQAKLDGEKAPKADIGTVITLDLAKDKLIGPFSALAGLRLQDLLNATKESTDKTTEVFGKVSFAATETITLWTKGSYNASAAKKSDSVFVKAGIDYTGIPLTTLGAEYDSNDLGGKAKEAAKVADKDNQTAGQFFVYAKVAY